ncbi:hypothetical protein BC938DRAFT_479738 [Jimgerdemannia flammicorona]|uniref:Ras GTPase-activating-like protein IQGAP1 n=1 Tax=Jimgerdemannia flammicorona TaxID=994334 RepID=A0A433QK81_9FUNG|nr:hypothetical protein BC938DRAFT_479738 [Jimgerdemannia flammicorona]
MASRTASTPLKRLSTMSTREDLSDVYIHTITDDVEDVVGMPGRVRLQRDESRKDRNWMDKMRINMQAYEYLCHIGEAKEWIEACLGETIDPIVELEESMRNGIFLAKLARYFAPKVVKRIFMESRLQFRHSDNINYFFAAIEEARLPKIFWFELTDLYEKKNIPKVIYCIHALSHLLARRNMAPTIRNLVGHLQFTDEQLHATQRGLDLAGVAMPNFRNVGYSLDRELNEIPDTDEYEPMYYEPNDYGESEEDEPLSPRTPTLNLEVIEEDSDEDREDYELELSESEKRAMFWNDADNARRLLKCQAIARTIPLHREFKEAQKRHRDLEPMIIKVQAQSRGYMYRKAWERKWQEIEEIENWAIKVQAEVRGMIQRRRFQERLDHYQSNVAKVVKIQSFYRAKKTGDAYRKLTLNNNPSVSTVKNFVHLLNDSDLDFEEELVPSILLHVRPYTEIEHLREVVIHRIRENAQLDSLLNELDIKIALLVKNRITLDEVIKVSRRTNKSQQRRMSQMIANNNAGVGSSGTNPFSLKALDKESRRRLELYQQLFYLLQTEPKYLAKLLCMLKGGPQGVADKGRRIVETAVFTLFGFGQNDREEYLMLKLFKHCIEEEVNMIDNIQEFLRGDYIFIKLVLHHSRGAKERPYFRDLLAPLVQSVLDDDFLDLDTDPISLYRKLIGFEEARSGQASTRPRDVTPQEALADPETRMSFIRHLQQLRTTTEEFLTAIIASTDRMPFGVRFIAKEVMTALKNKFPHEPEENIMKVIANFVYYRAPEGFDVVDQVVSPIQRKNLRDISKMLHQISTGKVFDEQEVYLAPLNDYVAHAAKRFSTWFTAVAQVEDAETHYDIDQYIDLTKTHKPIIYISPVEIFAMHAMLFDKLPDLGPENSDPLREILHELGPPPYADEAQFAEAGQGEISLTLTNRHADAVSQEPDAMLKRLFMETKRLILIVVRVQEGKDLRDILTRPVTARDEETWEELKRMEFGQHEQTGNASGRRRSLVLVEEGEADIKRLSFSELKKLALENILDLEADDFVTRENNFQDMINAIAADIVNKNRRRAQRAAELPKLQQTLGHLDAKCAYLEEQHNSYTDYISVCMQNLTSKTGRRNRFVMPFTRQYFHIRELQRHGKVPRFGSHKYTAKQLYEKGVLLQLDGVSPKVYDKIHLTIASDEVGIITVTASFTGMGIGDTTMELRFEDLLQCQFDNVQVMGLFDGAAKVNVNLLIFLVNKK